MKAALDAVSAAIGLTSEQLSRALTIRELVIRGESQLIQQEPDQASDSRDALAKAIYSVSLPFVDGSPRFFRSEDGSKRRRSVSYEVTITKMLL